MSLSLSIYDIYIYIHTYVSVSVFGVLVPRLPAGQAGITLLTSPVTYPLWSTRTCFRSKQRDPSPKDNSLTRKETSTCKGFHSTFAALLF